MNQLACALRVCLLSLALAASYSWAAAAEATPSNTEATIEAALAAEATLDFDDIPLKDIAATVSKERFFSVFVDRKALEDCAIHENALVTFHCADISLEAALNAMLQEFELNHAIADETLAITSAEKAATSASPEPWKRGDVWSRLVGGKLAVRQTAEAHRRLAQIYQILGKSTDSVVMCWGSPGSNNSPPADKPAAP